MHHLAILTLSVLIVACASSEGGGDGLSVTGTALVPGASPPLWIVVQTPTGLHLGAGATDATGRFAFEVAPPPEGSSVLLALAVDPATPARMSVGLIALATARDASAGGFVALPAEIDASSTADVWLRRALGDIATPLGEEDLARRAAIAAMLVDDTPDLCTSGPSPQVGTILIEAVGERTPTVRARFDRHAEGQGDLLTRLRAAQREITDNVASANQFNRYQIFTLGMAGLLGIYETRWAIASRTGLPTHGLDNRLTPDQLETAAEVSMNVGWGNCREKGLLGAYAASRFSDFKQVSVIGLETAAFFGSHAIAIACTGDTSVYDLRDYGKSIDPDALYPAAMLEADCYVIDPWLGTTERFTREMVERERWTEIVDGATVLDAPSPGPVVELPNVCTVEGEVRRCEPFPIESVEPPPPPPDQRFLGGCGHVEGFGCTNFYGVEIARASFRQSCEASGVTWYDDGCPTQGAFGSCVLPMLQTVFYVDPEDEDPDETAADARADCLAIPADAGGPGQWVAPYTGPR